jgi:hypothetical protein
MSEASDPDVSATSPDPTLAALVPQPSRRRNVLLAVAGAFILWAAWASQPILQPSVGRHGSSGSWSALGPHHELVAAITLTADTWPYATLAGVDGVAGADVAGAWLLPGTTDLEALPSQRPAEYATGLDLLRAQLPGKDLDGAELPQRLHNGGQATLIILWDITDCSRLREDEQVRVEIESLLGTTSRAPLAAFASPGFDRQTLLSSGTCPAA